MDATYRTGNPDLAAHRGSTRWPQSFFLRAFRWPLNYRLAACPPFSFCAPRHAGYRPYRLHFLGQGHSYVSTNEFIGTAQHIDGFKLPRSSYRPRLCHECHLVIFCKPSSMDDQCSRYEEPGLLLPWSCTKRLARCHRQLLTRKCRCYPGRFYSLVLAGF